MIDIRTDEEGNDYIVVGGNRIIWITNRPWIENLISLWEKQHEKDDGENDGIIDKNMI